MPPLLCSIGSLLPWPLPCCIFQTCPTLYYTPLYVPILCRSGSLLPWPLPCRIFQICPWYYSLLQYTNVPILCRSRSLLPWPLPSHSYCTVWSTALSPIACTLIVPNNNTVVKLFKVQQCWQQLISQAANFDSQKKTKKGEPLKSSTVQFATSILGSKYHTLQVFASCDHLHTW